MDDTHKDILLTQRVNLVDNINVRGGLYTQLLARKVMTRRQIQNIKAKATFAEQTEELLEELELSGSKAFDLFCEALIADHQQDIVDLFLKPKETKQNEDVNVNNDCTIKEVKPVPTCSVSAVSQPESQVTNSPGPKVVNESGSCAQVLHPNIAVREEFEQQTHRRSIEPSHLALAKPNLPMASNLEHDAYYFYQNSMSRPDSIPAQLNIQSPYKNNGIIFGEKEHILLPQSMNNSSASQMKLQPQHINGQISHQMIGNKSSVLDKSLSSINGTLPPSDRLTANPPDVFNKSSSSSLLSSSMIAPGSSQSPLTGSNPFSFQTSHVINRSSVPQNVEISQYNCIGQTENTLPTNQINNNYIGYQGNKDIHGNQFVKTEPSNYNSELVGSQMTSAVKLMSTVQSSGPNKQFVVERSYIEIPRHIEVNNSQSAEREMLTLPHYIQTVQTSEGQTNGQTCQEFVANRNVPRMVKNDSVDTMNKRPISDDQENSAKRAREDPDCIQTDKHTDTTIMSIIDDKDLIVKVVPEPPRRPSQPSVVIETEHQQDRFQKVVLQGVMDDPEIDLTDGPIDVKVEHCERHFYMANYKKSYSMRRIPRGKALILNVNEVTGKPPRRGTDIDRENLHNLLCQLHFDVTVFNDKDGLTAKEMALKLQDFSQDEGHRSGEAAIICILSHGEEGYIFGSDGKKFELDGVFSLFDNTCCPMLRGKPKIFIVQACRGGALDRGVQYYTDEHDGSDARLRQCPSMSDMLICYPTQNGYYAWRNRDRGSWYVEALVQVFMKYAKCEDICTMLNRALGQVFMKYAKCEDICTMLNRTLVQVFMKCEDICTMLNRVNLLVSKKVSNCPQIEMDQMSQMSEYKSTLRMPHLFFFPGIGSLSIPEYPKY